MDPNLLRIAIVILSFFGGIGVIVYGTGLLLMPREGETEPLVRKLLPFTRKWTNGAVALVTIAVALLIASSTAGIGFGPLIIVFCIWFFGFRGRDRRRRPAPPPEPTPFERAADSWRNRMIEQQTPGYVPQVPSEWPAALAPSADRAALTADAPRWVQPYNDPDADLTVRDDDLPVPVPKPSRRWLMWVWALVFAGSGVAVVALLDWSGITASPLAYAAALLVGLGLALLLSVRSGRPPLLLPTTLITALATGGLLAQSPAVTVPELGTETYRYSSADELPPTIERSVGGLHIDLSGLELTSDRTLDVAVDVGSVTLRLPDGVSTEVNYSVDVGSANVLGKRQDALGLKDTRTSSKGAGSPVLRINVDVDVGELKVQS